MMLPAKFHATSADSKLSPVDLLDVGQPRPRPTPRAPFCCNTYASIEATCTTDCPLKRNGCYVDAGFTKFAGDLLDQAVLDKTPSDVARIEARLIDAAWPQKLKRGPMGLRAVGGVPQDGARGGRDLRLHVGGDCADTESARILAGAASRFRSRGGGSVWTYTHSWRRIPRFEWGNISVLASVEKPEQMAPAMRQGYAPAVIVPEFPNGKRLFDFGGVPLIPCPAETLDKTCVECRLCLDVDLHKMGRGIAFEAHGQDLPGVLVALGLSA